MFFTFYISFFLLGGVFLQKQFYYDEWQPNFSTTIRSKGQVQKYLLTLTSQMDMLHSLRPMCVFLYYTSQKYNLTTSCRYSWRDLSYPSERILPQEIMHKSVIRECCLFTAAQGRPARFRTVRWRWLALHKNRWEAFKWSFAAGTTWKPYYPAEGSNFLLQLFWRGSFTKQEL